MISTKISAACDNPRCALRWIDVYTYYVSPPLTNIEKSTYVDFPCPKCNEPLEVGAAYEVEDQ